MLKFSEERKGSNTVSDKPTLKVNSICDALRAELDKIN